MNIYKYISLRAINKGPFFGNDYRLCAHLTKTKTKH